MSTATMKIAPKAKPASILLPCPCCGEVSASVTLNLAAIGTEDNEFTCLECNSEFSSATIRDLMAKWGKVLAWIDVCPVID